MYRLLTKETWLFYRIVVGDINEFLQYIMDFNFWTLWNLSSDSWYGGFKFIISISN